ncbi:MAG: hypothetical protein DWI15_00030 [Planctomycetota bacterium]|nr:MAG: hypothetical protein DWI15_00030 [Planctomycetota bacterium]
MTLLSTISIAISLVLPLVTAAQTRPQIPTNRGVKPKPPIVRLGNAPDWSVVFHPDSSRVFIGTYQKVVAYSVVDGQKQGEWPLGVEGVRALSFQANGEILAIGSGVPGLSGSITLLDVASGQTLRTIKPHTDTIEALAFSGDIVLSASDDETVVLTDIKTGKQLGILSEHIGRCLSIAVPLRITDGSGGAIFATGGADKMIKIWDANARRVVVNFDQAQCSVWSLTSLSQPGRFMAGCDDGSVRLFQVRADTPNLGNDDNTLAPLTGAPAAAPIVALKPGQIAARTGSQTTVLTGHSAAVYSVAASANGNYMASGGADNKVIVWNRNGDKLREHAEATGDVWSVAISPNSRWLAAASVDGSTRVYDLTDGTLLQTLPRGKIK